MSIHSCERKYGSFFDSSSSSSAVRPPSLSVMPMCCSKASTRLRFTSLVSGTRPSSQARQVTLFLMESISLALSFSTGTRRHLSMVSMSKSTNRVPWNKKADSQSVPPVPDILRPATSMSLRGLKDASMPMPRRAVMVGSHRRRNKLALGMPTPKNDLAQMISQPSWFSSKSRPPPPVMRRFTSMPCSRQ